MLKIHSFARCIRAAMLAMTFLGVATISTPVLSEEQRSIRFAGEFEPQSAVWMSWPLFDWVEGLPVSQVTLDMIRELLPHQTVKLLVNNKAAQAEIEKIIANTVPEITNLERLEFIQITYTDVWMRDIGPNFVIVNESELAIVDQDFDYWRVGAFANTSISAGIPGFANIDEHIDRRVARLMGIESMPTWYRADGGGRKRFITEGGNQVHNGKGTMISILKTEMAGNPGMTQEEIEEVYHRYYGVTNFIWLPEALVEDTSPVTGAVPGPGGTVAWGGGVEHADELAAFVDANTIIFVEISDEQAASDPVMAENKRRMDINLDILESAVDQDGEPFNIIRLPVPDSIYQVIEPTDNMYPWMAAPHIDNPEFPLGEPVNLLVPAGYMNYVITDGVVIAATYGQTEIEQRVREVLEAAFPDRRVVFVDPYNMNVGGGGMHCISHEEPALPGE